METRLATSVVLDDLLHHAPPEQVTLDWIIGSLHERSFGIVILLLALIGLVPGGSLVSAVLLPIPAFQMMLARGEPVLPGIIAKRRVPTPRLGRLIARVTPVLRRLERVVRPRWQTPFETTKRVVGFVILLMAASMFSPLPFSHVIPILVAMLIAFAFLEEDGVLLCISLAAAAISLAITVGSLWGTVEAWMALD